jgi:hypothetical protein
MSVAELPELYFMKYRVFCHILPLLPYPLLYIFGKGSMGPDATFIFVGGSGSTGPVFYRTPKCLFKWSQY